MNQKQPIEIDVQDIDHLGLIAGIVDEIGIVEIINRLLGNHPLEKISAGHVILKDTASHIKALILNCMGFLTAPLYLFNQFFVGKATEHLIGQGVKPEYLNDSRIGRVLDQLYQAGLTSVFVEIALAAVKRFGVSIKQVHLDEQLWSNEMILQKYKNQQSCERGFRFLKDPHFFASRMFVKSPQRVAALAMIMGLCLLVYSIGQRQLRSSLAEIKETIPNQRGKPTERPTLRWVLQCFQSVHLVWLDGRKWSIKLNDSQQHILRFLGSACQKYYFLC